MIKTLHSLRFVFIMFIVLSHIIGPAFDFGGECGVSFFFVLSGFVLSLAYGERIREGSFRTVPFVKKQLLKFYPLHLLTMSAMLVMDARLGVFYEWYRLLPNVLLLQSWIPDDSFFFVANGSSWFLSDMLFFYLVFSALFLFIHQSSVKGPALFGSLCLLIYVHLAVSVPEEKINAILYASPVTRIIEFMLGIALFRFYRSDVSRRWRTWLESRTELMKSLLEVLMVLIIVGFATAYPQLSPRLRCASLFWPLAPAIIFLFATVDRQGGLIARWLHQPWMLWLGGISFEIYLLHMLVMRVTQSVYLLLGFEGVVPTLLSVVVNTVLTILVAWPVKKYFVDKIYGKLIKHVI